MDNKKIIDELKIIRDRVDVLIKLLSGEKQSPSTFQNLEKVIGKEGSGKEEKVSFLSEHSGPSAGTAGGITGSMDLSDPIRDVYLKFIKVGEMTMEEITNDPSFEDKESLPIMVKTLVRQGYLEKRMEDGVMKYDAKSAKKAKKKISDEIWGALE